MRRGRGALIGAAMLMMIPTNGVAEDGFRLSSPVSCAIGTECFVQQLVDHAPGPDAVDYRCGAATYDGHKGTDIRLVSLADIAAEVPVVASAPGTVTGVRDGMADRLVLTEADKRTVDGRECGNGVVIDHGDGWETQYCHLKRGSIAVAAGDRLERGATLGAVGASGLAAFPHVHLSVRRSGETIDPFTGGGMAVGCDPAATVSDPNALWDAQTAAALGSAPDAQTIAAGFAGDAVPLEGLRLERPAPPTRDAGALAAYALVTNLRVGDALQLTLNGPSGFAAENAVGPLDHAKAQQSIFVGKRRRGDAWPAGTYVMTLRVVRAGAAIRRIERAFTLD